MIYKTYEYSYNLNLSKVYGIPYDDITLSENDGGIVFQSWVILKNKTRSDGIFQMKTNQIIRDRSLKCFTSD